MARQRIRETSDRAAIETAPMYQKMFKKFSDQAHSELQVLEARLIEVEAPKVALEAASVEVRTKPRCAHYGTIKEFWAICRERGLDAQNKAGCRAAVGMLLGRRIETRADLSGAEWAFCTNAVRMGRLFW